MQRVDGPTVRALELRAPGSSTFDAETIQSQLRGAQIFRAFSDQDRAQIQERLLHYKGLIPSLWAFSRNICYWKACVDSMRHLVTLTRRDTILTALERHFTGINQHEGQVVIQVDKSNFTVTSGSQADQVELGCRHLVDFAMRHFVEIPRAPVRKNVLGKPRAKVDSNVLRQYAELARRLGFEYPGIDGIMMHPHVSISQAIQPSIKPPLVASGPGEKISKRCGLPTLEALEKDRNVLFPCYLDEQREEYGEGITSFFVGQSISFNFFGQRRVMVALNHAERERRRERKATAQLERQAPAQRQREERGQEALEQREHGQGQVDRGQIYEEWSSHLDADSLHDALIRH